MTHGEFVSATEPSHGGPAVYFRRALKVSPGLRRATLRVTALGVFEAYINGSRLGEDVLAPTWTSYRHRLHVTSYDVTELLREGENVLGAIVGEGWASGPLTWDLIADNYSDRPALFAELDLGYTDRSERIVSDESFRTGTGAVRENGIYAGERYDARLHEPWAEAGFDDTEWPHAQPYAWNLDTLVEDAAPPIRRVQELAPVSITRRPSGAQIVDFGQVISGWVRITVTGPRGTEITLRHAELLTPEGDLERETLRKAESVDTYVMCGSGSETWEPRFTFHGFRYAEIEGWPGDAAPDAIRAVVIHTDMARTGWFETSDDLVNRLHENVVWSMRGNFVGLPTDCPQRDERLGWTGDLNAFAPTATYLYDVRGAVGSWLADLRAEQAETGSVPWTVPDVLSTPGGTPTALWSDAAISVPWQLFQEYGDASILRDAYPSMTAFMDQVEAALDDRGLWSSGFQFGDWLDPDAPADNPSGGKTDAHLVAQAYLRRTSRELAETAQLLGHADAAAHYRALSDRARQAFRDEYVTKHGRVTNESATAYALAIVFDLLDTDQLAHAGERLARIVADAKFTISTGFAGTPLVTDALTRTGNVDSAYRLLMQTACPSFLYPVTMGATTIWERWDSVLPDGAVNRTGMTSLNHYALGAVADWLHREVGGLQRLAPGWERIRIAPNPGGGLTFARGALETVRGRVESKWRIEGSTLVLDVEIPEDARAEVVLPLHPEGASTEVGPGRHTWEYEIDAADAARGTLSLSSTLTEIASVDGAWQAVRALMIDLMPGVPVDAGLQHAGDTPLNAMLERLPGDTEAIAPRFEEALRKGRR